MAEEDPTNQPPATDPPADPNAWKPPTKEEWEKLNRTAEARKTERQEAIRQAAALKAKYEPEPKPDADKATGPDPDVAKYKTLAVKTAARAALKEAGYQGSIDRALRLMELDGVEPDDDDRFTAEISELKKDMPGLFGKASSDDDQDDEPAARRPKPNRRDTSAGASTLTADQRSANALLKQAGYR